MTSAIPELQNSFRVRGRAGRLATGSRTAAMLGPWEARHLGGESGLRWRFEFETFQPDVYWFENGSRFRLILEIGHRGLVHGPCDIVCRDPLMVDMEVPIE